MGKGALIGGIESGTAFDHQKTLKLKTQGEILQRLKEDNLQVQSHDDRDMISEYDYKDKRAVPLPKTSNRNKKLISSNLDKLPASHTANCSTKSKSIVSDSLSTLH